MIYIVTFLIFCNILHSVIITSKFKILEKNYEKIIAILAGDFDTTTLKQIIEKTNIKNPLKQLTSDFPLSYEELELLRNNCFNILKKIDNRWVINHETNILGTYYKNNSIKDFSTYTILKREDYKEAILLIEDKAFLIISGINKELTVINWQTDYKCQTLLASSEVLKLLVDFRQKRK